MLHVKHIADSVAAASDVTGVLAAAAGAVLVGLAIAIPWLHRGEGAAARAGAGCTASSLSRSGCSPSSTRSCR